MPLGKTVTTLIQGASIVAYYMRTFANTEYNMAAVMEQRGDQFVFVERTDMMPVQDVFGALGITPEMLSDIYTVPAYMNLENPAPATTWEELAGTRNFRIDNIVAWQKMAALLGKTIRIYEDVSRGMYCDFEFRIAVTPEGEVIRQ